jgi:hypothetical protein
LIEWLNAIQSIFLILKLPIRVNGLEFPEKENKNHR